MNKYNIVIELRTSIEIDWFGFFRSKAVAALFIIIFFCYWLNQLFRNLSALFGSFAIANQLTVEKTINKTNDGNEISKVKSRWLESNKVVTRIQHD